MCAHKQFTKTLNIFHLGLCSRAAPSMLTTILGFKMINFALDHPPKKIALIRKMASYSANRYVFGIVCFFFNKNVSGKGVLSSFTVTVPQPNEGWEIEQNWALLLHK